MPPTTSKQALEQLYGFRQNRKKAGDIMSESERRLGLPSARERQMGLRGAISNTENLLRNVDPSVTGRTQGQLVTEAQRQAIVNQERAPVADQFREQSRALEGETENLNQLTSRAASDTQLGIGEQDSQERSLQNIYQNLFGQEQEEARRRQEEEDTKRWWTQFNYQKQQDNIRRQDALRAAAKSVINPGQYLGGSSTAQAKAAGTDPLQQIAYNDVYTRVSKNNDLQLISDYNATLQSANYGNAKDKLKVELYKQLRPDLFQAGSKNYLGAASGAKKAPAVPKLPSTTRW